MFTCIICMDRYEDDLKTDEHVFPDALGGTLVIDDVCGRCNSLMGQGVDAMLVEHQAIQFSRKQHRLASRNGRVPDPLAVGVWVPSDDTTAELTGDERTVTWSPGRVRVRLRPEARPDGSFVVQHPPNQRAEAEAVMVRFAVRNPGVRVEIEEERGGNLSFDLTLADDGWIPGALKAAYELAYLFAGERYLADPTAALVRPWLRDPTTSAATVRASQLTFGSSGSGEAPISVRIRNTPTVLAGAVFTRDGHTVSYVRYFDKLEAWFEIGSHEYSMPADSAIIIYADAGREARLTPKTLFGGSWI
jgi:hypothetical protein